jgi:hypothetical protein
LDGRKYVCQFPFEELGCVGAWHLSVQRFSTAVRASPVFALIEEWGIFEPFFVSVEEVRIRVNSVAEKHQREERFG